MKKKILIFIVSYNSSFRILNIINKLKKIDLSKDSYNILISDDFSTDDTTKYIKKIKYSKKIKIILNKKNLGYGGNIKQCLKYALSKKYHYAIMIHGDDQYDVKYIPYISKNLKDQDVHIVTGSRMLNKGGALNGKMPIYKFIGNIILTKFYNFIFSTKFSDCHTGLWGYNLSIFKRIKISCIDEGYNFDNHLRIMASNRKMQIKEIPIKTFYRTETSSIHIMYSFNFIRYILTNMFKKN